MDTAAAVPAFIRVQYNRWLASLWIGYKYVYLADFYTLVATVAELRIKDYRCVWSWYIRDSIYLFLSHYSLLLSCVNARIVLIASFVVLFKITPVTKGYFSYLDLTTLQLDGDKLVPLRRVCFGIV